MQELADALERESRGDIGQDPGERLVSSRDEAGGRLDNAAVKWATYCLQNLRGKLLADGLEISRTMAEFVSELVHPTSESNP